MHVELASAWNCDGVLLALLDLEVLRERAWTVQPDDGFETMQLHFIGNGLGSTGAWESIASASGGEGRLRHDLRRGDIPTYDGFMRLLRTDGTELTSSAKPVRDGCPPV